MSENVHYSTMVYDSFHQMIFIGQFCDIEREKVYSKDNRYRQIICIIYIKWFSVYGLESNYFSYYEQDMQINKLSNVFGCVFVGLV